MDAGRSAGCGARPVTVLVAGSLHLDVVVEAPRLPRLDETLMGSAVAYRAGGKGLNQALAAARMGAATAMAGAVGADAFARDLLAALDAGGVDRRAVEVHPGASGMSVALVRPDGDYAAVVVSAANRAYAGATPVPRGTRLLLLQNEVPEAANRALARAARAAGARVILNAAPARPLPEDLAGSLDLLVVNRIEAQDLTGSADPAEAARRLAARGAQVIVTLGAAGLVAQGPRGAFAQAAPRVAVVSAHGAGDAFVGALAAFWAEDLPAAARLAQAAAALTVATPPDARGTLTRARVEAFAAGPSS
jgi:ribokinase